MNHSTLHFIDISPSIPSMCRFLTLLISVKKTDETIFISSIALQDSRIFSHQTNMIAGDSELSFFQNSSTMAKESQSALNEICLAREETWSQHKTASAGQFQLLYYIHILCSLYLYIHIKQK